MPKKILLADDSITIQKVVELTFSDGDYEVTAVNNGAKAVQKLAEMRPDIILSDIIMPEKNGYEVCEYVKSHPDFRNIPVVLLTGTFEPFDPDRAEKAGCDAVVTKPFESQSLIHKVEELIAQTQSAAPVAEPEAEPASPWMDEPAASAPPSGPETGVFTPAPEAFAHTNDIFNAPTTAETPEAESMPFEAPSSSPFGEPPAPEAFSTDTRAFPRMSFEELQQAGSTSGAAAAPEAPSWPLPGEAPAEPAAQEPPAWPDMTPPEEQPLSAPSFGSLEAPQTSASSPFDEQPADLAGETRGFPKMSFDDFQQSPSAEEPAAAPSAEMPPWDKPAPAFGEEAPAFGGETRAFPKMSFDDFSQNAPAPAEEAPLWSEQSAPAFGEPAAFEETPAAESQPLSTEPESPAFSAETSAFPKMSFDDFQQPAAEPEAEPQTQFEAESASEPEAAEPLPWDEPPAPAADSFWSPAAERPTFDAPASESYSSAAPEQFGGAAPEELAPAYAPSVETEQPESETQVVANEPAEDEWAPAAGAAAEAAAEAEEPVVPPAALAPEAPAIPIAAHSGELTEEQVDRIARRVVELMSEQVVRNIAWEVIPDMAEMVVKERIRQLESEA